MNKTKKEAKNEKKLENNKKNLEKSENKQKGKKSSAIWLFSVCILAVGLVLFCQFYFGDPVSEKTTYFDNTKVNGIDISGLTKDEASALVSSSLTNEMANAKIVLESNGKSWELNGSDFEYVGDIDNSLQEVLSYGREGNMFEKKKIERKIKNEGLQVNISYENLFGGMQEKVESICEEIEKESVSSQIKFEPNNVNMFSVSSDTKGFMVDREQLNNEIDKAIATKNYENIEIPLIEIVPDVDSESLLKQIGKRSEFTTSYAKSSAKRKNNIKKALEAFNGMTVLPNEEVSFNKTTGPRTKENGYENANIIIDGSYVPGAGGGVCQASTTLYNALLLGDIEVITAHHHSLPASYVPLSFDAMVSEGYADLVFKNNTDAPIFIKTICDENNVTVEIYGKNLDDGVEIKTRSELVKILPHQGDKIIPDTEGKYSSQVLYKGEYYRLKYPKQGYESKGYLQYFENGQLVKEKEIRHDHYQPQMGIIIEGTETLEEGMKLPDNNVKFTPPQKLT